MIIILSKHWIGLLSSLTLYEDKFKLGVVAGGAIIIYNIIIIINFKNSDRCYINTYIIILFVKAGQFAAT